MSKIPVRVTCSSCNTALTIEVSIEGLNKWQAGGYIQDALPELTADERELLISQTCKNCWDELFAEIPED